jgi:thioredoxin-dependent peroxiredoxin
MPLAAGNKAPEFTLMNESGQEFRLSDYIGKTVLLYFYPKDDTPGCTKEACNFRDDYSEYDQAGVTILGISPDTSKSHAKFKAKYELPFTLLADPDHQIASAYGVWGRKQYMGREYDGILRTTFLIGPDSRIFKVFENVKPAEHSAEVLAELKKLPK